MKKKSRFLQTPIEPFAVEAGLTADQILARMERISFQGRNLATAHRIWQKMLQDDVTIFLGMAGALSAGGLRLVVAHLIANRYVDCLVSTGANLYHDLHETRGQHHYRRLAVRRRCGAGAGSDRSRLRHLRQRGRVLLERRLDRRFRDHARDAALHHARVPPSARRPSVEDDRPRRHPDRGLSRQRADLLPGDRRFVDRHGAVAGAPEEGRRRLHRHHRRHRRVGEPGDPAPANGVGRPRRRHAEELHQPGAACRPSSTATRSAAIATRCRS